MHVYVKMRHEIGRYDEMQSNNAVALCKAYNTLVWRLNALLSGNQAVRPGIRIIRQIIWTEMSDCLY